MHRRQFLAASTASLALAAGLTRRALAGSVTAAVPAAPAAPAAAAAAAAPAAHAVAVAAAAPAAQDAGAAEGAARPLLKGRIRHSVARWCYGGIDLETLCRESAAMGIASVEIVDVGELPVLAKHGLTCAVVNGPGSITQGWNRPENHDALVARSLELLPRIAAAGAPNMIVFSGNADGLSDEEGIRNCITGLKRIMPAAEQHGVTVVMELLNSKVDHADYQFDNMAYGVAVVQGVGSERFRILYDIYHAQIMEGDVIRTIRDNIAHIGHFHTGGVPGRREIDETQELNYPAICRAIADTGFSGFVAQEFIPARDPLTSLREAVAICDV